MMVPSVYFGCRHGGPICPTWQFQAVLIAEPTRLLWRSPWWAYLSNMAVPIGGPTCPPWQSLQWAHLSNMAVPIGGPTHLPGGRHGGPTHLPGGRHGGPTRPLWRSP